MSEFLAYLQARGAAEGTITTNRYRLEGLVKPSSGLPLRDLTPARCQALYSSYTTGRKPDTHQGALSLAKAFGEWARKAKHAPTNPWVDVDPVGKKSRGKFQHRVDESRKYYAWLVRHVDEDGALAVLTGLLLGLREHEILGLVGRDLDDDGRLLHISKSKTKAGVRPLVVPHVLRAGLKLRVKAPTARIFPFARNWVLDNTKRTCEKAGVPSVCAHALRGAHATLALEAGSTPEAVARALGHTRTSVAKAHYAQGGSGDSARVEAVGERLAVSSSPEQNQDPNEKTDPENAPGTE